MSDDSIGTGSAGGGSSAEYDDLLLLDDLESLLEDLEEQETSSGLSAATIPRDLRDLLDSERIATVPELRARIAALHAKLDAQESS